MEPLVMIVPLSLALSLIQSISTEELMAVAGKGWYDQSCLWRPFSQLRAAVPFVPAQATHGEDAVEEASGDATSNLSFIPEEQNLPGAEPSNDTSSETEAVDQTCPRHTSQQAQDSLGDFGKFPSAHPRSSQPAHMFCHPRHLLTADEWSALRSVSRAHMKVVDGWDADLRMLHMPHS